MSRQLTQCMCNHFACKHTGYYVCVATVWKITWMEFHLNLDWKNNARKPPQGINFILVKRFGNLQCYSDRTMLQMSTEGKDFLFFVKLTWAAALLVTKWGCRSKSRMWRDQQIYLPDSSRQRGCLFFSSYDRKTDWTCISWYVFSLLNRTALILTSFLSQNQVVLQTQRRLLCK